MGHIELAAPVSHIWFFKTLPSKIGTLLDMTMADLEKVLYFDVVHRARSRQTNLPEDAGHLRGPSTSEIMRTLRRERPYAWAWARKPSSGLLEELDLEKCRCSCSEESQTTKSQTKKKKLTKRLKVVEAFLESGNKPRMDDPRTSSRSFRRNCALWFRSTAAVSPRPT